MTPLDGTTGSRDRADAATEAVSSTGLAAGHPATRPGRLLALTMVTVFGAEAGVMALLGVLPPLSFGPEALVDAALLSILVFPILYLAVFRPLIELVTALEATQQELRTSRSLLADAQRVAQFGHWEWQLEEDRVQWSPEATRIFGTATPTPVTGFRALLDLVHQDDRDHFQRVIDQVIQHGGRVSLEHRAVGAEGGEIVVNTQVEIVRTDDDRRSRVIGVVRDITEPWRAQRALERAHAELDQRVRERTADLEAVNRALERERSFSNAVVDTSGGLIIVIDADGRIVRFNEACERTTGYRADEVVGKAFASVLLPVEEREPVLEVFKRLTSGEFPAHYQNHWMTRGGDRRFISWANTAMLDDRGKVEYVIGTGLDITEQRAAEEALRESEERLRSILRTAREGFWLMDADGHLLDVNDAYCEIVGYSRSQLIGAHISMVEATEDREAVARHVELVLSRGHDRFETRHRHKTGRLVDLEVSVSYLPFSGGQLFTFLRDVTDRKRDAAELERRRAELEAIFNSNADAIVFTDTERRIALTNPAFTRMFGYSADEVRGQTTHFLDVDLRPEEIDARPSAAIERELEGRQAPVEVRCRRKDGSTLWVELLPVAVRDARGSLLGYVGVHRDISERREAEATIRASLQEKEVLLKEIHHRVKNNLQVIASLLYLQADQLQDPASIAPLRESQNRIRSLALVHEKLYRSQDLAHIDFRDYVVDLAESIVASVNRGHTAIHVETAIDDVAFSIDTAIPVALIINELISNSVKHAFPSRPEGRIRVEVEREASGDCLVAVEDDGVGLPGVVEAHTRSTLGLQLVEVLATQLGGSLSIESDDGTRFEVRFRPEPTAEA